MKKFNVGFIAIGQTKSSEETGFSRYVGLGSTFVKAVQPTKKEIDEFFGYESKAEPEYVKDGDNGKEVHVTFLIQTDPKENNGITIKSRAMFTLRMAPNYSRDQTSCEVIDNYGNHQWIPAEDAKAGKAVFTKNGNPAKIDTKYRIACVGECDLVDFLKKYLCVTDAFEYANGVWSKKADADNFKFGFTPEDLKKLFAGNFQDLKDALALQPNNKIKLLYGVKTTDEGKQQQAVCMKGDMMLACTANANSVAKLAERLANAKARGSFERVDYRVCELQKWNIIPTNLDTPVSTADASGADDLPFEAPSSEDNFWND